MKSQNRNPAFQSAPAGRYFIKMHGLRNHFVITDGRQDAYRPEVAEIVRICDPETGVGGDQLIVIEAPTPSGLASGAAAFMRILNVDGREVEACGNATRCVAWLLLEEAETGEIGLETLAGTINCRRTGDMEVSCEMGEVTMDWQDIPLAKECDTCHLDIGPAGIGDAVALNIGNPHVVFFVDDLDAVSIESFAPAIQKLPLFPNEVNVGIAEIIAADHIRSVVFERGAGLTTACGSGACVAVYAALARGLTDRKTVTVSMPAGEVLIDIDDNGSVTMTGPVAYCFSGYC
jgi:diaminopimelate epimerase